MKDLLLKAPDSQLDDSAKVFIRDWSEPPSALQVLRVLDHCVYTAGASDFMMQAMNIIFEQALARENKKLADLLPEATWRAVGPS